MKPAPEALRHLASALDDLAERDLLRDDRAPIPEGLSFSSNDYLGLAAGPSVQARSGAGASRLVDGDRPEHRDLERDISAWIQADSTLCFSSGYAANVGALAALVQPGDLVVSDELNHASIIDGLRLARGNVTVVPHCSVDAVRRAIAGRTPGQRAWVVTESYFSMDADIPDLGALRAICDGAGAALYVDEAHALGVLGPNGRGLCAAAGIEPDVLVGTLGKAMGAAGAFVSGCASLRTWLWNRARSFVFSTGLSPAAAATAGRNLATVRAEDLLRARVAERAAELRRGLGERGIHPLGTGHIVPWVLGRASDARAAAMHLRERGVFVQAIRPPSVPAGSARLRLAVSARHDAASVRQLLDAVDRLPSCLRRSSS